jgi:carboxylesterase
VAPESAKIVYNGISTPVDQKRIVWFKETEHEMFRDCEREAAIEAVVDYVRERVGSRSA